MVGFSQARYTLSGYLKDESTGEVLINATVYVNELKTGTVSNEYGFFSITLPKGTYHFIFSYIGYKPREETIDLDKDLQQNFSLTPQSISLSTVTISGETKENRVRQNELGSIRMNVKELDQIPLLFGEQDILKSIQLLPGILPASEGNSSFYVRGGDTDQNLILLDDAPVFNPSHMLGFFSVFNSDVIKDLKLYKGGVPARFGGRASSVLDIHMKEGNMKEYKFSGGIGLISARFTAEGPISKDKSSFIVSGRRTYADLFLPLAANTDIRNDRLYFYDLNLKSNLIFNKNNRFFLSGYFGRDVLKASDFGLNSGNRAGSLRWNHQFSPSLFLNTTLVLNDYDYVTEGDISGNFTLKAGVKDISIKQDYTLSLYKGVMITYGFSSILHRFKPGEVLFTPESVKSFVIPQKKGLENAIYLFSEQKLAKNWEIGYGFRYSFFSLIGPGIELFYDKDLNIIKSDTFPKGKFYSNYSGFEPRVNISWYLTEESSLKAGYNRMSQYIHLLSNSSSGTPVDYWLPCSNNIKPQFVSQYSLGYYKEISTKGMDFSVEAYYKDMANQIDYRNNADIFLNENAEAELLFGKGRAYGVEFLLRKNSGPLTGWISYTLSRSEKKIDDINNGNWYPARQDRTHNISTVFIYQLNQKVSLSATWVYYTGNAITFPSGKYIIDNNIVSYFTSRNAYRMPAYHRLDLGASLILKKTDRYTSELNFGLYNAYARKNAYTILFRTNEDDPSVTEAVKVYLFLAIPSITWNFRF